MNSIDKQSKIYIAGHTGLVGSAIVKKILSRGYNNLILKTHAELDLTNQIQVSEFFQYEKPDYVILSAAKVGGILANNSYRADFIYQNIMIQSNVIHHSYLSGVKKLLFLGSTCIYPKKSSQPIKEENLLSSELEYTNEPYAIAKISGIKMCESYNLQYGTNFISVMPTNLFGPNDNFNLETSHVLPALIRKLHLGKCLDNDCWKEIRIDLNKNPIDDVSGGCLENEILDILSNYGIKKGEIEVWGSGLPRRDFLWSDDMADACLFILEKRNFKDFYHPNNLEIRNTHINIGTGIDISVKDLASKINTCIKYEGKLNFNLNYPDGVSKKLTDVSKLHRLGWKHTVSLEEGIEKLYSWYLSS